MATVIVRHRVGDFGVWIHSHEERAEVLGEFSSSARTFQDVDEPNSIVLVIETDEPGKLTAMLEDPGLAELKASHTVIEPIIVSVEVDV